MNEPVDDMLLDDRVSDAGEWGSGTNQPGHPTTREWLDRITKPILNYQPELGRETLPLIKPTERLWTE